jgi:hypothetical protein
MVLAGGRHCLRAIGYFYFVAGVREVYVISRTPLASTKLIGLPLVWRGVLASLDRRSEDVRVLPIVIAELELCNIERHIFPADLVETSDNAALEYRPKALDSLGMDCADDILTLGMVNGRVRILAVEAIVASPLIGAEKANFVGDGFPNKGFQRRGLDVCDYASNNVSLAADSANDWRFAGTDAASSTAATALVPMSI